MATWRVVLRSQQGTESGRWLTVVAVGSCNDDTLPMLLAKGYSFDGPLEVSIESAIVARSSKSDAQTRNQNIMSFITVTEATEATPTEADRKIVVNSMQISRIYPEDPTYVGKATIYMCDGMHIQVHESQQQILDLIGTSARKEP